MVGYPDTSRESCSLAISSLLLSEGKTMGLWVFQDWVQIALSDPAETQVQHEARICCLYGSVQTQSFNNAVLYSKSSQHHLIPAALMIVAWIGGMMPS